jgi:hypothetical protein
MTTANIAQTKVVPVETRNTPYHDDFSEDAKARQMDYVYSEAKETLQGFLDNDVKEILDGIADVFVTVTYLLYIQNNGIDVDFNDPDLYDDNTNPEQLGADHNILVRMSQCMGLINCLKLVPHEYDGLDITGELMFMLADVMQLAQHVYGVDINTVIAAVLTSNWSKFPEYTGQTDAELDSECVWIQDNRKKTNVSWRKVELDGKTYIVYRDDNGNGKIQKPSSFVEPQI